MDTFQKRLLTDLKRTKLKKYLIRKQRKPFVYMITWKV